MVMYADNHPEALPLSPPIVSFASPFLWVGPIIHCSPLRFVSPSAERHITINVCFYPQQSTKLPSNALFHNLFIPSCIPGCHVSTNFTLNPLLPEGSLNPPSTKKIEATSYALLWLPYFPYFIFFLSLHPSCFP